MRPSWLTSGERGSACAYLGYGLFASRRADREEDGRDGTPMTDQSAPDFGGLLRQLRTRARLTQQGLAKAVHLTGPERVLFVAAALGQTVPVSAETSGRPYRMTGCVTPARTLIGRDGELATLVELMAKVAAG